MKQIVLLCLLLCIPLCLSAQQERELMPVNWKTVEKEAKKNPEHIKELVTRLSASTIDTTLTYPERILAFYGQTYLTNDAEESVLRGKMDKLKKEGQLDSCLYVAKKILDINPLNLNALIMACDIILDMAEDAAYMGKVSVDDGRVYYNRAMRIFNTIAMTGDGSAEHPFYVTTVSDEYCFMRYYLNLWKYKGQALKDNCDIIYLNESSEYYNQPEIYFEITRVLERRIQLFK